MDGLTQLKTEIEFAIDDLKIAGQSLHEMNNETEYKWTELVQVEETVVRILKELEDIFPESLKQAIKEQEEYEDDMFNQADAMNQY